MPRRDIFKLMHTPRNTSPGVANRCWASTGERPLSFVDVAIPGIIGLVLVVWPQAMFAGSKVTPDAGKIRTMRIAGVLLLVAAAIYLVIKLVGA